MIRQNGLVRVLCIFGTVLLIITPPLKLKIAQIWGIFDQVVLIIRTSRILNDRVVLIIRTSQNLKISYFGPPKWSVFGAFPPLYRPKKLIFFARLRRADLQLRGALIFLGFEGLRNFRGALIFSLKSSSNLGVRLLRGAVILICPVVLIHECIIFVTIFVFVPSHAVSKRMKSDILLQRTHRKNQKNI